MRRPPLAALPNNYDRATDYELLRRLRAVRAKLWVLAEQVWMNNIAAVEAEVDECRRELASLQLRYDQQKLGVPE